MDCHISLVNPYSSVSRISAKIVFSASIYKHHISNKRVSWNHSVAQAHNSVYDTVLLAQLMASNHLLNFSSAGC